MDADPEKVLLLDTSAVIDGRIADLIEANFIEGIIVVPRFVLKELQQVADSHDAVKRARGRRGLEMLERIQKNQRNEVKIHDGDFPEETGVDAKLVRLARNLNAKDQLIPIKANDGWEYQRTCTEGPVFDARQIMWEASK